MSYGINVIDANNTLQGLGERPAMIAEVITLIPNQNGSKVVTSKIANVCTQSNYTFEIGIDSSFPVMKINGNTVSWEWKPCRNMKISSVTLIIITGGG